jgi:hypothetical protein
MKFWILAAGLLLAGCGGNVVPRARPAGYVPVPSTAAPLPANVGALRGQTGRTLITQFGQPQRDIVEGPARKLQFLGPICVLDAYLYPPANGRGEPVVTWLDTRQRDGSPIDQASCVAALSARRK